MLPRISPYLRLALVFVGAVLFAAPVKVTVVSDDHAAVKNLVTELKSAGAEVTEADRPRDLLATKHDKDEVIVLYRKDYTAYEVIDRAALADLSNRGIAFVALRGAIAGPSASWARDTFGAGWTAESRRFRALMMLNVRTDAHPLAKDASTFDVTDDTVFNLELNEKIHVLASSFTSKVSANRKNITEVSDKASIYDIQPQAWVFENARLRSAVFLQGDAATLAHASYRTFIKRGIAWAARRSDVDELCTKDDLVDLRYPVGGPSRAEKAIAAFQMQPGFKAGVVVTEPLINKPIAVQWDERGRMWIAETPEYPNGRRPLTAEAWREGGVLVPGSYDRPAQDKISVLVDTDGDGKADQKQLFHEGLELITGFCHYKDGVIVVCQPHIVWLRDTDGDGKADKEQVLYGGFTPGDTHFVANHFILAPDGWVYASNGGGGEVFPASQPDRKVRLSSGTFRFKPDGSAIEQIASQGGNSFGNEVTSDMELFHGKATNGNPIQHVVLSEAILAKAPGTPAKAFNSVNPRRPVLRKDLPDRAPLLQIDQVGYYTAACSVAVQEHGAWPEEYRDTIFITEPILDIIHFEKLRPEGPTFLGEVTLKDREWLRSMDHWFCPIDVSFGPDGALYVLDFYTPVVAHNDTRGPMHSKSGASVRPDREHYFGRVYRIQHESAPKLAIPDLSKADVAGLIAAFSHPNKVVRFNALRSLMDRDAGLQASSTGPLNALVRSDAIPEARVLALWALQRLERLESGLVVAAAADGSAAVRKNAFLVAEAARLSLPVATLKAGIADKDARVRLAAVRALGAAQLDAESGALLLSAWTNDHEAATATAAASANPAATLEVMLSGKAPARADFAVSLAATLTPDASLRVLRAAAASADAKLAASILREIASRRIAAPAKLDETRQALRALLAGKDTEVATATAAIAGLWLTDGSLKAELAAVAGRLLAVVADEKASVESQVAAVRVLVLLRDTDAKITPALAQALTSAREPVAVATAGALATSGDVSVGKLLYGAFPKSTGSFRSSLYAALVGRPEWAGLILDALEAKSLSAMQLGPMQVSQLVRHPDAAISQRSAAVLAKLNAGSSPAKDDIVSKLRPEVEKPGDAAKGKELFVAACQTCHKIGNIGNDFGPNLQGIGSHPPAEMLVHIVDPNRMVDDEHRTWNFKMKDGTQYSALIGSENPTFVKLKLPAGQSAELKVADIVSRERSPNSLMPEGFESLGAEGLRNVIAYLRSVAISPEGETIGRFRLLDLRNAFTASTTTGLYASKEAKRDTLPFAQFGKVESNGVPYRVIDPKSSKDGLNVIVLKGGAFKGAYSRSFPQKVEIPVGSVANRIHFLGAVGGWGAHGDAVAMIAEVHFLSGKVQKEIFYGARDFADYNGTGDVPGSKSARQLLSGDGRQVRTLWFPVESNEVIDKLVLSSEDTPIAPTTVAVTIEIGGPTNPPRGKKEGSPKAGKKGKANEGPSDLLPKDNPKTTQAFGQQFGPRKAGQLRVLVAGAGSSHNFPAFFLGTDALTAKAAGYDVAATPNLKETLALLPEADLFVFSGNHAQFGTPEFQKAIRDFAAAGKGIVLLHAATWYNWPLTTKYNEEFVCGGARGHGHSDFTFTVTMPEHPIMKGVPATFVINDESYNVELTRPEGAEVLGTIPRQTPKEGLSNILPSVWTVKYPGTKVVCIALGHDEKSHDHPAYKQLLLNSLTWVSNK
ncbi:MAG: PVC-type heme-binding CxxCH protein [Opitutales bacterium]